MKEITQSAGNIFLNNFDVATVSSSSLQHNMGIVPKNPQVYGASIRLVSECIDTFFELTPKKTKNFRTFLNVNNTALSNLSTVLQRFHIWQAVLNLPKEMDEPVSNLTQDQRQLLCMAKFWLMLKPVYIVKVATFTEDIANAMISLQILIVENPHPDIIDIIDEVVPAYFSNSTVLIIGSNSLLKCCKKFVNLDE